MHKYLLGRDISDAAPEAVKPFPALHHRVPTPMADVARHRGRERGRHFQQGRTHGRAGPFDEHDLVERQGQGQGRRPNGI